MHASEISWSQIEAKLAQKSPVQLVKNYHEVPDSVKCKQMFWPAIAQVKEDGVYLMAIKHEGDIRFFSRTGNEFYTEHRSAWWSYFELLPDGCWITELINPKVSLEVLSGLINTNRVQPWTMEEFALMYNATFKFHDYVSVSEFVAGKSASPYSARWCYVKQHVAEVHLVRSEVVYNEAQWLLFVGKCIQDGEEGAVLKQSCAGWVAGHKGRRVTKAVRGIDIDLTCTGVILGTGKMDGLIAGLKFEWEGKPFTAGLGKGWDLEFQKVQTMAWSQDEFNVVGQIWRVTALQESSKGVLRLPKVGEMRIDKQQADA